MISIYENVVEEFNKRNCKLLVSENEFYEIKKNNKQFKLYYTASCGHNHNVFYNVFKSRNTGITCPSCKNKEICKKIKEQFQNCQLSKTCRIEQEFKFIKDFQKITENDFNIIKAFDGCNVDIIYKPKYIEEDKWVGIQVKTTNKAHLTYSFGINNNNYKNCLILLFCVEDDRMWLITENIIINQQKISIGYSKSKYNIYKVTKEDIINKLNVYYNITSKFNFDILNTPTNMYQQREQIFKNYRKKIISFINFHYDEMEGTVYDFKINNYKVQEKVCKLCEKQNRYIFFLCKNNGLVNGKPNKIQYDIGDNDFYWLNCDDKKTFFVIPEQVLVEKGFVGNKEENKNKQFLKITIKDELHYKLKWLESYRFNYETINEEPNKDRLCNLLIYNIE
jgi:hypothetical protein